MKSRSIMRGALALVVAASLLGQGAPTVRADDLQDRINQAQQDLESIRQKQAEVQNALADVENQAKAAQAQLSLVDAELAQADGQLQGLNDQVNQTRSELAQIEADLKAAQERYEQRKEQLGTRIRAIRETGRVDYLSVLLGAASFQDFVGRLDLMKVIVAKDKELFDGIRADKLALEQKQGEVADRKDRLETLRLEAQTRRDTVAAKRNEREQVSRSLEESRSALAAREAEYAAHSDNLSAQVAALVRQANRKPGSFNPIPPVPRPWIVTSEYGPRISPIAGVPIFHKGVDLNVHMGQPVTAIEAGVVIVATSDSVMGYYVVIDHGGGITSWYAHNSRLRVSVGDTVAQGQQIGDGGSTGWSTGPHCHLEIHVDGTPHNPLDYLSL